MSLVDRLKAYQQEKAAKEAAEAEAERISSETRRQAWLDSEQKRLQEAAEKEREQVDLLQQFLDQMGAKEHLLEIMQAWGNMGEVDQTPKDFVDSSGLHLGLSWRYKFTAKVIDSRAHSDGSGDYSYTEYRSLNQENSLRLLIAASIDLNKSTKYNVYGSYSHETFRGSNGSIVGFARPELRYPTRNSAPYIPFPQDSHTGPIGFPPYDLKDSKSTMEEVLFGLLKKIDQSKSSPVHLSKYSAEPNNALFQPWLRRIFG